MSVDSQHLLPPAQQPKLIEGPHPPPPEKRPGWIARHLWLVALAALVLLALIFLIGYLPRRSRQKAVAEAAQKQATMLPPANVAQVQRSPATTNLLLPGSAVPFEEAYIYARATGYISKRYADIGDRVVKNQLLAEVDSPDLDAQVAQGRAMLDQSNEQLGQAQAALENAQAAEDLARVTWQRYQVLVRDGAVSRQDADQQLANYRTAQANTRLQEAGVRSATQNIRSMRSNLERLIALQSFEQVRAPFSGVITARNFDIGALVSSSGTSQGASTTPMGGTQSAGTSANSGISGSSSALSSTPGPTASSPTTPGLGNTGELFRLAQIDTMRILVAVPQENATTIRSGATAQVFVQQLAGRTFQGRVTRTASELDPTARTLLTEVDVPNRPWALLPGMYTQVRFADLRPSPPLLIPSDALMETADGLQVAVLLDPTDQQRDELKKKVDEAKDKDLHQQAEKQQKEAKRIHVQTVQVGRDYGPEIEIASGLRGWEYLVINPGDKIRENALVMPRPAADVAGENAAQPGSRTEPQPGGFGSPSETAPTQQKSQGGQQKGQQNQNQGSQSGKKNGGGGK